MTAMNRGFTLIEMIISITLLAIVSLSIGSIIQYSMAIYVDTVDREELILQGRFVTERMNKEIRDTVPNSIQVNAEKNCIEWIPVINTAVYENLPMGPVRSDILRLLPEKPLNLNDRMVVMPSAAAVLFAEPSADGIGRVAIVSDRSPLSTEVPPTMINVPLTQLTTFEANSPARRLYIYQTPLAYCLEGSKLYRYSGYPLSRHELSPNGFSDGKRHLMAENIKHASFEIDQPSLVRNGLVKLQFVFNDNNEEVRLNHDVLIFNTP
ncbi:MULTISPECIES: PilW family protein [unclassified Aliivibrio]|uniref:PilW family protein n=1 Tax=unclassified Aliivibrio TaxID=2645654 RepID=UPI000A9F2932|nr:MULTISPECIES: type II secretion system protein [unclassified Aliivibrio]